MDTLLDLYSDYLISSFGLTTATGLATLLKGGISHDQVTRFLSGKPHTSADLWKIAKPFVRRIQSEEGVMIVDDSIAEKPYTDENDIVCWHYDHSHQRTVKGINFLTALYHSQGVSLPVGFALIAKTEHYIDKKDGKEKRRSPVNKNEHYRTLLEQAVKNQIPFRYVLNDVWYSSAENMMFIKHTLEKDFIMPIKSNRKVALSLTDKLQGRYVQVETLAFEVNVPVTIYLDVDFPAPENKIVPEESKLIGFRIWRSPVAMPQRPEKRSLNHIGHQVREKTPEALPMAQSRLQKLIKFEVSRTILSSGAAKSTSKGKTSAPIAVKVTSCIRSSSGMIRSDRMV